jgi:hypothetical protein
MAIYTASSISLLDEAYSSPNNSHVDFIAVIAHVKSLDCQTLFPNAFRELALQDDKYMLI